MKRIPIHLKILSWFWPLEMQHWERMPREVRQAMHLSAWHKLTRKHNHYLLSKQMLLSEQVRLEHNLAYVGPKALRCFLSWFALALIFLVLACRVQSPHYLLFSAYMWGATIAFGFGSVFMIFHVLHLELNNFRKKNQLA